MKQKITIQTSSILIGNESIVDFELFLNSFKNERIFILVDTNTRKNCLDLFLKLYPDLINSCVLEIKEGEFFKSIESIKVLSEQLIKNRAERSSLLINLGGGVICDLGGFLASIFNRGIKYCNVPTTLLSQVDASIGGKTAVNFNQIKNKLGVFYHPQLTLIIPDFLKTLPESEINSGFGEIFKYALIKDKKMWNTLIKRNIMCENNLEKLIQNSISIKKEIVEQDLFDTGIRKILNFGHTIGHAVESVYVKNPIFNHGFCVVIGIICECFISNKINQLKDTELSIIIKTLLANFPLQKISNTNKILSFIISDKKNKNQNFYITTLSKIGKAHYNTPVNKKIIIDSINYYNTLL